MREKIAIIEYLRIPARAGSLGRDVVSSDQSICPEHLSRQLGSFGWLGVGGVFVISGFVIPQALLRAYEAYSLKHFPHYLMRRLVRLEPPYLASIALVILLAYASAMAPDFQGKPPDYGPAQVAVHLFYLIPFTSFSWINPVYWTLAYEFAFYLFMGLAWPLLGTKQRLGSWLVVAGIAGMLTVADILLARSMLFVMGIAAYRKLACGDSVALFLAIVAAAGAIILHHGELLIAFIGAATALLIAFGWRVRLPGAVGRMLLWLELFPTRCIWTHVPVGGRVINLGRRFIEGPYAEIFLSLVALRASIAYAAIFHRIFERPALAWSRRLRRFAPGMGKAG